MKYLDQKTAAHKINSLWKSKSRFLFVISFDKQQSLVLENSEINTSEVLFDLNGITNYQPSDRFFNSDFTMSPISFEDFQKSFEVVTQNISYGNSFLTNLTFQTPIETNLSLQDIFEASKAKYRLWLKDQFVLFSPETFVKVKDGIISSYPMKGTIDANLPNAENLILNDPKEMAEHVTIVDLIRNDLSIVAKDVGVSKFRYIDHLKTAQKDLLQVSSEIRGELNSEYKENIGDMLFKLLPAGSITGAPKPQTLEIIEEAENYNRGFYTGVFGYCDGEKLDSSVMIRFIENNNGQLFFKSGGGITHFSDARKEYQEYLDKIYLPIYSDVKEPHQL